MADGQLVQQGVNEVRVLGNVAVHPKAIDAKDDGIVLPIDLLVSRSERSGDEWVERVTTVRAFVFGRRAKSLVELKDGKGLQEGDRLLVSGRLEHGAKGLYFRAEDVILCGGKKRDASAPAPAESGDDLPF